MRRLKFYDVQQLLKRFGTIIYTRDRLADIDLMEMELRELYKLQLIEMDTFKDALFALRTERELEEKRRKEKWM